VKLVKAVFEKLVLEGVLDAKHGLVSADNYIMYNSGTGIIIETFN
jgi:hypothetical protein